jgi:isopentenyl-diphosphate delta-isomerase
MTQDPKREHVVLVDRHDQELGSMEKLEAHRRGLLHRAFSIFLFGPDGRVLLQQRAHTKYHSPGLWSNACCSHVRPGEPLGNAAVRRLREELGMSCVLEERFAFTYRAEVGHGLVEHEIDHVFFGQSKGLLFPDPLEVAAVRWTSVDQLDRELREWPNDFTPWLSICWPMVKQSLEEQIPLP